MVSGIEEPLERLAQVLAWSTLSGASKVLKMKPFDRGEEREAVREVCFSRLLSCGDVATSEQVISRSTRLEATARSGLC